MFPYPIDPPPRRIAAVLFAIVRLPLALLCLVTVALPPTLAEPPLADAHSLCLPSGPPPPAGYVDYAAAVFNRAEHVIPDVPGYLWRRGCGPTAAGMVIGYWDGNDHDALIPGDASGQTSAVNQAIASSEHYNDYSQPIDDPGTGLLRDASYHGGAHASNCLGDFMETSWYTSSNYYGWSWFTDVDNAFRDYVDWVNTTYGADYDRSSWSASWSSFSWGDFTSEIDALRPLVFLVDTDGNGQTDHFVTVIGYRDTLGYQEYACLDTWSPAGSIRWEHFRGVASGSPWGIYGATYFQISGQSFPDCNENGIPDDEDIATGASQDCNENGIPDECDVGSGGASEDINENGIPDECEPDCNNNDIPDDYDISSGTSEDCNGNENPDECDLDTGASQDCNSNSIPDECDLSSGASQDVNGNGIPDECDPLIPPAFLGIGDLDGGSDHSVAQAISDDGSIVVGYSVSDNGDEAFRWTHADGMAGLGDLPDGSFASYAQAISTDGATIVGAGDSWASAVGFRHTAAEGLVTLGVLFGGDFSSRAYAVSADGGVIVGTANSAAGDEAFRWTPGDGLVALGDLSGGMFDAEARGVSADGGVIVGTGAVAGPSAWAFRWTEAEGMLPLWPELYQQQDFASAAFAVSADGAAIVGSITDANLDTTYPMRWTTADGFEYLHDPGVGNSAVARGVNDDGTVIVGTDAVLGAFIWRRGVGTRAVQQLLNACELNLAGWTLTSARATSANGRIIVGEGLNPSGETEAWIAILPCYGDLNADEQVDLADLAQLLCQYGLASGATYADGDLDGDADVDLSDLSALLAVYNTICD